MKNIILILALLLGLAACSSHEPKAEKKVDKLAQSYDPVLDREAQLARVITMIQTNVNLDDKKKTELIKLVNEQYQKATEVRKKQSQLRAVLIDQLLEESKGSKSATLATSKELENLNKKNIKELNNFILKFRSISGETDLQKNNFMREVGNVNMI